MADDPRARLERLGGQEPPAPRHEFTERLADDLRRTEVVTAEPAPRWGVGRWVVAAAAAAAVVGMALVVALLDRVEPLELEAARSVRVIESDGDVVDGVPGLVLSDGDRVVVGADGRAEAGDVVLGPGDEAVVVDGRLEPVPGTTTSTTSTTSTTVADRTTTTVADRTTTTVADRTTTTVTDRTTTTTSAPARSTTTTVTDRTTTTVVSDRTTTTATRPATDARPSR